MKTIFLQFDNTTVRTNQDIFDILNEKYSLNNDYKVSKQEMIEIFEKDEFFQKLQLQPGVLDVLTKYSKMYDIFIIAYGSIISLQKMITWIHSQLPSGVKFLGLETTEYDPRIINMEGCIQISNDIHNLNSNAQIKILYTGLNEFPCIQTNVCNDILVVNAWDEIDAILDFYFKYDYKTLENSKY